MNMSLALLMLGSISVPHGFSSASPARFWAWVRYFSAISTDPSLRVTSPFVDLDPHQRGILSDDFGVAIGTLWLNQALGGFYDIVDGRRFLLNYASLLIKKSKKTVATPPKVGPNKCPDFVVLDKHGKWHVLECKGTQTNIWARNDQLKTAINQKRGIDIVPKYRGERLASGIFIGNDTEMSNTDLKIIDPEVPDPYVTLGENDQTEAKKAMKRLSIARSFGLSGLTGFADELSLPDVGVEDLRSFFKKDESRRINRSDSERLLLATNEMDFASKDLFEVNSREFMGREITIDIPIRDFTINTNGATRVTIKQGIDANLSRKVRENKGYEYINDVRDWAEDLMSDDVGLTIESTDSKTIVKTSNLFVSTLEFN